MGHRDLYPVRLPSQNERTNQRAFAATPPPPSSSTPYRHTTGPRLFFGLPLKGYGLTLTAGTQRSHSLLFRRSLSLGEARERSERA